MEERERAKSETHQIVDLVMSSICRGPGWRRVASFINMTNPSYNCPTGHHIPIRLVDDHILLQLCVWEGKGYQFGITAAFGQYIEFTRGIDSHYVC